MASIGQGVETAMAQICAETLGVDYTRINVVHGQTDRIDKGMGAFASRVTVMCGEATRMASVKLRDAMLGAAAELMQTSPDLLDIVGDEIVRTGGPGTTMKLAELATARPDAMTAEAEFKSSHMVYPYGAHVVQLTLDTDTGAVAIERYLVAFDIGKAVNPKLVEGQIIGGLRKALAAPARGVPLYGQRRSAFGDVRRLPDADRPRNPRSVERADGGRAKPTQSPWIQGRRRRWDHAGRRRDCVGDR